MNEKSKDSELTDHCDHTPETTCGSECAKTDDKRVITLSANSLNLSTCMRKFRYAKLQRYETHERAPSLDKGELVHLMAKFYYLGKMQKKELGLNHAELIDLSVDRAREAVISMDLSVEDAEECITTWRAYCTYYKDDPWEPLAVEAPFSVVLYEDDEVRIVFEGRMDLVCQNPLQNNMKLIVDHKTGSRNQTPTGLSNQFMGYCVVGGTTMAVMNRIGFQKTLPPKKKFVRHILSYPKSVLEEWVQMTVWRARFVDACVQEGHFPPDFTKCDEYGGCQYKEVCLTPPEARQDKLTRFFRVAEPFDVLKED